MRKRILHIACLFLASLALTVCVFSTAFALEGEEPSSAAQLSITKDGFLFTPPDQDQFLNFKEVMPGDVREQVIEITNDFPGKVEVFLRAEPVSEEDAAFLSQLKLEVYLKGNGYTEDALLSVYNGLASENTSEGGNLDENFSLGVFREKTKAELIVRLTVPNELGNDFQNTEATINWVYSVVEIPELPPQIFPTPTPVPTEEIPPEEIPTELPPEEIPPEEIPTIEPDDVPKTGDPSGNAGMVFLLMLCAVSVLIPALRKISAE